MYGNTKSFMSPAASMGVLLVCKFDHDKRKGGLVDNNNFKKYNDDDTDKCIMYRVYPVFFVGLFCLLFFEILFASQLLQSQQKERKTFERGKD